MRLLSVAALAVSAAIASAQAPPISPPAGSPPTGTPGTLPPSAVAPAATAPLAAPVQPAVRPTGNAAVVNNQAIPEVAVFRALRQFPPTEQAIARKEILSHLIDNTLIDQYLNLLKVTVEPAEIDKLIGDLKAELAKAVPPKEYAKELEGMMLTEAEFRAEVSAQMKWDKFVKQQATDANLKTLYDQSPTVFDGSLVKCRHILLASPADATTKANTVAALRKLRGDLQTQADTAAATLPANSDPLKRQQVVGAKLEELFSETAKKSSTCPSAKDGGNLDFFPRVGAMVEPFSKVAFELPVYGMSDVVETEFGLHLILVTAKKPGTPKTFEQVKDDVRSLYAFRLREAVVGQMKPKAQVSITPTNPVTATGGTVAPMR